MITLIPGISFLNISSFGSGLIIRFSQFRQSHDDAFSVAAGCMSTLSGTTMEEMCLFPVIESSINPSVKHLADTLRQGAAIAQES
jgi:hypothetical protein